ncbi:MAG: hypothetical protein AB7U73_02380 [Pirellulales bacterium]
MPRTLLALAAIGAVLVAFPLVSAQQSPDDAAARWDGFRNRLLPEPAPVTEQAFGYRRTNYAGGARDGEIGGRVQRSTVPATYAMPIAECSLDAPLRASGRLALRNTEGGSGAMIGWFNADSRGWRTPNSLGVRVDGNGGKYWMFYEYGTRSWQTGGGGAFEGDRYQTTPTPPFPADGTSHAWSLAYQPGGADEPGRLVLEVDDRRYEVEVPVEHKRDGAALNRFGIWNVQIAGAPLELYVDDLVVGDRRFEFDDDPGWIGQGNHAKFAERVIRPHHDYGQPAGKNPLGDSAIGGIVFRDEHPSYFGLPVGPYSLDDELYAAGRMALVSAASDSGVYLGWFDSQSKQQNERPEYEARQPNILALLVEGPSRIGHWVRPAISTSDRQGHTANGDEGWPTIRPDSRVHEWELSYRLADDRSHGTIELVFDGARKAFTVTADEIKAGATFDRFGLFNMQSGGHHVEFYVDELRFARGAK